MFFKAKFNNVVDESLFDNNEIEQDYDSVLGKEIIRFKNHEFEVERNGEGFITEITYCNQCVLTYNIEEIFIELIANLLNEDERVTLVDSEGLEEDLTKNDLFDM